MKVLICGSRDYTAVDTVNAALDALHRDTPVSVVITGGCRGADRLGKEWAHANKIPCVTFAANWEKHGKAAGPIRNQSMIESRPDLVIAFGINGRGTQDTIRRAREAGIHWVGL